VSQKEVVNFVFPTKKLKYFQKIVVQYPHQSLPTIPLLISPVDPIPIPFLQMQLVPNKCKIASNVFTICP